MARTWVAARVASTPADMRQQTGDNALGKPYHCAEAAHPVPPRLTGEFHATIELVALLFAVPPRIVGLKWLFFAAAAGRDIARVTLALKEGRHRLRAPLGEILVKGRRNRADPCAQSDAPPETPGVSDSRAYR